MFLSKSMKLKKSLNKSTLDHFLFFIENYLPQKKNRGNQKEIRLDTLQLNTINQIQKLVSVRCKASIPKQKNIKVSLILGKWALPYIKLFKNT